MTLQRRTMVGAWGAAGIEDETTGSDNTLAAGCLGKGLLVCVTHTSTQPSAQQPPAMTSRA